MIYILFNDLRENLIEYYFYEVLHGSVLLAVNRATAAVQSGSTAPHAKSRPHVCVQVGRLRR